MRVVIVAGGVAARVGGSRQTPLAVGVGIIGVGGGVVQGIRGGQTVAAGVVDVGRGMTILIGGGQQVVLVIVSKGLGVARRYP